MSPEGQPKPEGPNTEVCQYVEEGAEKREDQKAAVEFYKWSDIFLTVRIEVPCSF